MAESRRPALNGEGTSRKRMSPVNAVTPHDATARRDARLWIWAVRGRTGIVLGRVTDRLGGAGIPTGVWCNWQHAGFWFRQSRFESWYPSVSPVLSARARIGEAPEQEHGPVV